MMQTIPVPDILARRSIRAYTDEALSEEQIATLLQAAMAAPSASNLKPWHFVVVTQRETLNALAERHPYAKMLYQAPACIVVCGDMGVSDAFWVQDCSAATENILLAATGMGLGACWLGVHPRAPREAEIRQLLDLPKKVTPLCLISIGYPAEEKPVRTQFDAGRVHRDRW